MGDYRPHLVELIRQKGNRVQASVNQYTTALIVGDQHHQDGPSLEGYLQVKKARKLGIPSYHYTEINTLLKNSPPIGLTMKELTSRNWMIPQPQNKHYWCVFERDTKILQHVIINDIAYEELLLKQYNSPILSNTHSNLIDILKKALTVRHYKDYKLKLEAIYFYMRKIDPFEYPFQRKENISIEAGEYVGYCKYDKFIDIKLFQRKIDVQSKEKIDNLDLQPFKKMITEKEFTDYLKIVIADDNGRTLKESSEYTQVRRKKLLEHLPSPELSERKLIIKQDSSQTTVPKNNENEIEEMKGTEDEESPLQIKKRERKQRRLLRKQLWKSLKPFMERDKQIIEKPASKNELLQLIDEAQNQSPSCQDLRPFRLKKIKISQPILIIEKEFKSFKEMKKQKLKNEIDVSSINSIYSPTVCSSLATDFDHPSDNPAQSTLKQNDNQLFKPTVNLLTKDGNIGTQKQQDPEETQISTCELDATCLNEIITTKQLYINGEQQNMNE